MRKKPKPPPSPSPDTDPGTPVKSRSKATRDRGTVSKELEGGRRIDPTNPRRRHFLWTFVEKMPNRKKLTVTFRRRRRRDTWHFCRNCSHWPESGYETRAKKPTNGE